MSRELVGVRKIIGILEAHNFVVRTSYDGMTPEGMGYEDPGFITLQVPETFNPVAEARRVYALLKSLGVPVGWSSLDDLADSEENQYTSVQLNYDPSDVEDAVLIDIYCIDDLMIQPSKGLPN